MSTPVVVLGLVDTAGTSGTPVGLADFASITQPPAAYGVGRVLSAAPGVATGK
jgi:hypothetical protein